MDDAHAMEVDQRSQYLFDDIFGILFVEFAGGEVASRAKFGD